MEFSWEFRNFLCGGEKIQFQGVTLAVGAQNSAGGVCQAPSSPKIPSEFPGNGGVGWGRAGASPAVGFGNFKGTMAAFKGFSAGSWIPEVFLWDLGTVTRSVPRDLNPLEIPGIPAAVPKGIPLVWGGKGP